MITILLIIFLGIIICYTFRICKLKKEGFSIFDGSFFDFGQQKMYMEFRKGGSGDQIGETNKGFTHEIKNIVGELGSSGGQAEYKGETSFSQNLDSIQEENTVIVSKSFKDATKALDKLKNVGTYAMNRTISKEEAFEACFQDNDTWSNDNYAVLVSKSTEKKTNGRGEDLYKPACVGVAYSGPNKLSKNGTYYLLGNCVKEGKGDCLYYMDDVHKGKTFFNGMEKVPDPWRPVGQNATTFHPMIIDKVWYLDKQSQGSVSGTATEYEKAKMKDVLKIAVLDPKTYDNNAEMVQKARDICSKGLLAEFSKVNNTSEKTGNWFKDPEQGTYKNVKCVGFSIDGEKKEEDDSFINKPNITFYGIPESNLSNTFKKVVLDLDSASADVLKPYIFEKTGSLTNSYKILNASLHGSGCVNTNDCETKCEDDEGCIGYQKTADGYKILKNGFEDVIKGDFVDTDKLSKTRDVYKHISKYDTLNKNFIDIEKTNGSNNLFSTIINSNDNYKNIIETEKRNVDKLISNLKSLLEETDIGNTSNELTKCEILKKLIKYHAEYHKLYKNGSDDDKLRDDRHGKKIGLMKYYEDAFKDMEINQIRKSSGNETNMSLISKRGVSNSWWERLSNFFVETRGINNQSFLSGAKNMDQSLVKREIAIKKLLKKNYANLDGWKIKNVEEQGDLYTGFNFEEGKTICKGTGGIGEKTKGCDLSNVQLTLIGNNKNFSNNDIAGINSYENFFDILNDDCGNSDKDKCITHIDISNIKIEFEGYYDEGWAFQNNGNYSFANLNLKSGKFVDVQDLSCNIGSELVNRDIKAASISSNKKITFSGCKACDNNNFKAVFGDFQCKVKHGTGSNSCPSN